MRSKSSRPTRATRTNPVRRQNPLGKIPVLVLEDATTIFDSRVIVEYLDMRAGGSLLTPSEPNARENLDGGRSH
jgi:glutathione S-transferase